MALKQNKIIAKKPDPDPRRRIGFGLTPDMGRLKAAETARAGLGEFVDLVQNSVACPIYNMPVIEQVRWTLKGPITQFAVEKTFGAEIDLFGSDKNPEGIDFVETTMAQIGELQTHTLACAIGFHLEPEPLCWTAQGNAVTHPTTGSVKPPSPDVFTQNDLVNGALGADFAGTQPTKQYFPAILEWGWWANLVAWHMVRGYDLRWRIGQHTNIMDEILRHTAYMPPNAQEGSASNSQVDIVDFVFRTNERYQELGSGLDFLPIDFIRLGSIVAGVPAKDIGVFRPSRAFEVVGATYGGMDLRNLLGANNEFRKLALPYLIAAGIPIGLFAQEADTVQADLMRRFLSASQGQDANVPPLITPGKNFNPGPTTAGTGIGNLTAPVMVELSFDCGNIVCSTVTQQMTTERAIFKGGDLKITLAVKGFEVDSDWYNTLQSNKDLRDIVLCECGCAWAGR